MCRFYSLSYIQAKYLNLFLWRVYFKNYTFTVKKALENKAFILLSDINYIKFIIYNLRNDIVHIRSLLLADCSPDGNICHIEHSFTCWMESHLDHIHQY